jgi:hypothetical protein
VCATTNTGTFSVPSFCEEIGSNASTNRQMVRLEKWGAHSVVFFGAKLSEGDMPAAMLPGICGVGPIPIATIRPRALRTFDAFCMVLSSILP